MLESNSSFSQINSSFCHSNSSSVIWAFLLRVNQVLNHLCFYFLVIFCTSYLYSLPYNYTQTTNTCVFMYDYWLQRRKCDDMNDSIKAIITALYRIFGRRIWVKLWRKWRPIDEIDFAVLWSITVTDEFEFELTKTGDKARNWMTMFQNSVIDRRRNWNEHSHIPECPGRNWKHIF